MKYTGDFFGHKQYLILQLSNSSLVMLDIGSGNSLQVITPANTMAYSRVLDIAGDDLYEIVQSGISYYTYVSHDTGATWLYDTLGVGSLQILYNLALDSSQNVYLSSTNGLYKQATHATTWSLTGCPAAPVSYVYSDGRNRVWAFGYNSGMGANVLYYSADEGSTWHLDTAGLVRSNMSIISMGTDPLGNVYAIGQDYGLFNSGNLLYKSTGGTSPFVRIDAGILALNAQSGDSAIFNCVTGDSSHLYAATNIGSFMSSDGGNTWQPGVAVEADNCYGLAVANNGSLIASTDLGCFVRQAGDTVWNKVFPQNGYAGGQRVWRDDAGTIYSGASMSNPWNTHFLTTFVNAKSTDNGQTWSLDTNGSSAISQYSWWVDENGNEYAGGYGKNWVKRVGGTPWTIDTLGMVYGGAYDPLTAFGSDHNGTVYCAVYSGNIFSRSTSGTTWTEESGLGGDPVYTFAHTSTHTMVAGGTGNVHYKTSSSWQNMPINSPAPQGTYPYIVAVDDSDNVWTAFSHIGAGGLNQGDGVFFTPDLGAHWYPAGGQVILVTFQWLVPSGDSVFGVTYGSGVYVFNRSQTTGIREVSSPYHMDIQPNPSSTASTVTYDIVVSAGQTEVVVFDMSGKELKHLAAVGNSVNIRTDDMAAGDYLCALRRSGNIIAVKKLVVK